METSLAYSSTFVRKSELLVDHLVEVFTNIHGRSSTKGGDEEEGGKKKKGGIQVPEDWPWEAAKELFRKPDVIPADECEVC
jgi:flap endonuclease-1